MKKIPYPAYGMLTLPGHPKPYRIPSSAKQCNGGGVKKCVYLCPFYGFDRIGPRIYAVFSSCGNHPKNRERIYPKKSV